MRRWLTVRALGLGALALTLMAAMAALGLWQLGAYDKHQAEDARARLAQPPVPLDQILGPDSAFPAAGVGRPVTVTGRYDVAEQVYVRQLPGSADQYAVATPLVTSSGSVVLVVRGSARHPDAAAPVGAVTVRGVLQPSQALGSRPDDARVTDGLRVASLLESMTRDLYAGYVVLTTSEPAESLPAVDTPLPRSSRWAGIRNLLYALQWWVFAAFVGFMWWRIVRDADETQDESHLTTESGAEGQPETLGYRRSP